MTPRGCTFCGIVDGSIPASIVYRDPHAVAFLDARPVFKGHVLVVPTAHFATLPDLPAEAIAPYFTVVQRVARALPVALAADGTFVAENNVISQSVPHLHFHIVPRKKGDGLRGFFWPRVRYQDDGERDDYAGRIAAALA